MAPESTALTIQNPEASPYQLSDAQTLKASSSLLRHIHKSAHDHDTKSLKKDVFGVDPSEPTNAEPVWLVLTTKKHIIPQPRLKPCKIHLPHSLNSKSNVSVCLITPDPQRPFKDLIAHPSFPKQLAKSISRVIGVGKLEKKYKSFEARRQMRDSHDVFLADDRILTLLSKSMGKTFYSSASKRPISVRLQATRSKEEKQKAALPSTKREKAVDDPKSVISPQAAAKEIENALSMTTVNLSPSVTTSIRVGLSSHSSEQLVDNIKAVVSDMAERYVPRNWKGIQSIHIKGPNTMALPIWLADELWQHDGKVVEEEEMDEIHSKIKKSMKYKRPKHVTNPVRLGIEAGLIEENQEVGNKRKSDNFDEGQEPPRKKQSVGKDGFSKEMRERREKLREVSKA